MNSNFFCSCCERCYLDEDFDLINCLQTLYYSIRIIFFSPFSTVSQKSMYLKFIKHFKNFEKNVHIEV